MLSDEDNRRFLQAICAYEEEFGKEAIKVIQIPKKLSKVYPKKNFAPHRVEFIDSLFIRIEAHNGANFQLPV